MKIQHSDSRKIFISSSKIKLLNNYNQRKFHWKKLLITLLKMHHKLHTLYYVDGTTPCYIWSSIVTYLWQYFHLQHIHFNAVNKQLEVLYQYESNMDVTTLKQGQNQRERVLAEGKNIYHISYDYQKAK